MFFLKKILIVYNPSHDLISIGFDEKTALNSIQHLYPRYKSTALSIQASLQNGTSMYDAIETLPHQKSFFKLSSTSLHTLSWLKFKIEDSTLKQSLYNAHFKACLSPILFLLVSTLLNIVFIFIFIPQTQHMLIQFNVELPIWITYIEQFKLFLLRFGPTIILMLIAGILLLKTRFKPLSNRLHTIFFLNFEIKKLLEIILCMIKNGSDLKTIAANISCHHANLFLN